MSRKGSSDHTPASRRDLTEHYFQWFIFALFHVCKPWLSLLARGDLVICRSKRCLAENWVTFEWKVKFSRHVVCLQVGFQWDFTDGDTGEWSLRMKTVFWTLLSIFPSFDILKQSLLCGFCLLHCIAERLFEWRAKLIPRGATNFRNMISTKKKMYAFIIGHSSLLASVESEKTFSWNM